MGESCSREINLLRLSVSSDHVVAGTQDQLADGLAIGRRLAEQRGGLLDVRVKLRADKIGDPLGAGEI